MFERKKVSHHSEGKKAGGNTTGTIKMNIPSIDGLEVEAEETVESEEEEVVEEKKNFISFFKNLSLGSSSKQSQKQSSVTTGGCGCFQK